MKVAASAFLLLATVATNAHAHQVFKPILPSVAAIEVAERARIRPLTAGEMTTASAHWMTRYVYLEAAVQAAMIRGAGATYLPLATEPPEGCLNGALHDLFASARDGQLTEAELDALWERHGNLAYLAHQIGTAGGDNTYLVAKAVHAGFRGNIRHATVIGDYFDGRLAEPASGRAAAASVIRRTVMHRELGIARLIEMGTSARDELWEQTQSLAAVPTNRKDEFIRGALVTQTIRVLGAVNDPRIHQLPSHALTNVSRDDDDDLRILRARASGERDLRFERPVLFWEKICWMRNYGATSP